MNVETANKSRFHALRGNVKATDALRLCCEGVVLPNLKAVRSYNTIKEGL